VKNALLNLSLLTSSVWSPISGGITAPDGFLAAGISAGLKPSGKKDLALLYAPDGACCSGTFTQSVTRAYCVDLCIEDFIKKAKSVDMIYLDSPNNPTGFQFSNKDLEKLIKSFSGPIIIDEAYGEFSNSSVLSLVKKYPNIILVKTLSKAFGLAGLRIGYMIADKKITEVFSNVIQYPYPLNTLAIECGILAIEKSKQIIPIFEVIKKQRARIIKNLKKYDAFDVFDSNANFVLFDAKGADTRVYNALIEQGISIRKLGKLASHKGCLRVTIGTPDMNSKFLLAIRDLIE